MLRRWIAKLAVLMLATAPAAAAAAPQPFGEVTAIVHEDTAAVIGRSLALTLSELSALEATHVASSWALSADRGRRAAVAQALGWVFPLLPDAQIIEHLAGDPDPRIRAACARAAWARRVSSPVGHVLVRLCADPDPEVRAIAARAR